MFVRLPDVLGLPYDLPFAVLSKGAEAWDDICAF